MCEPVRESISALLDGETPALPPGDVERHLATCADCRAWQADVLMLQRRTRINAAAAAGGHDGARPGRGARRSGRRASTRREVLTVRLGLVLVAVAQLVLSGPVLLLGHDHAAPEHVAHELGAFSVAVAIGLILAALRPRLATGMVPILGIVALLLLVTAGADLALGNTQVNDEFPHLLELGGFLLLLRLAYLVGGGDWTPLLLSLRRPANPGVHGARRAVGE